MRHGKSDYPAGVDDHGRPLSQRGRLAAALMGAWLRDEGLEPDLAYVSTARRAEETWARMGLDAPAAAQPQLYLASAETMLEIARRAPDDAGALIAVWHQPGIREAANRCLGGHVVRDFPTAQIVVIEFDAARWRDIGFGAGRLVAAAAPKRLV